MRYWVYINNKVDGPYDENNLVTLQGFTPDTLLCSEEVASSGGQEWVKASSIFEFDEIPVNEPTPQAAAVQPQPDVQTQALLAKLEALTNGMFSLQSKLDSMQHNLDNALEQNKKLSEQVAQLSQPTTTQIAPVVSNEEPHSNTITLTRHDMPAATEDEAAKEEPPFPTQAAPEEEEVIIRSALDSLYGGKPVDLEDTFQDLMPEKTAEQQARKAAEEEQAVRSIEPELEFVPVQEGTQAVTSTEPEQPQPALATPPATQEEKAEPLPAEALDEIEKELTSLSLADNPEKQPAQEPVAQEPAQEPELKEAIITTPGIEETAKDALINELTASPKEDILDQIIAEHQQEAATSQEETHAAQAALGAAAAGLAAASLVSLVDNQQAEEPAPMAMATDKENPEKLEEVLPADQMPQDVPAPQDATQEPADLPSVEETPAVASTQDESAPQEIAPQIPVADMPEELPQPQEAEQITPEIPVADASEPLPQTEPESLVETDLPNLDQQPATPEESLVEEEIPVQEEVPAQEETPAQEEVPVQEEVPAQSEGHSVGTITDKDLQDAFGSDDTDPTVTSSTVNISSEPLREGNPNDLTEIELKEGSTYLISDFVPPSQLTDNEAAAKQQEEEQNNKKQETIFQDMLATVTKSQSVKTLNTDGLPDDLAATQVNLENTIQAKRGASLDIKTVPMVPEPEGTERLDMNELNDVNAQHGLKTAGKLAKSTKTVILALVGVLLLIILYVALGMMKLLPASLNLFTNQQQAPATQTTQEILAEPQQPQLPAEEPAALTPAQQAQEKVQNFPLPNGMVLKAFIESKHASISPELITWETTEAVEADNYSVTVKVPPENPQNFKTVYRFNYSMVSGLLEPTVSDAKNLLDQAYGVPSAQPEVISTPAATSAPKDTPRTAARKGTGRKRTN